MGEIADERWAGTATLRAAGEDPVVGLAEVWAVGREGERTAWQARFFSREPMPFSVGTRAALVLPEEFVAEGTVEAITDRRVDVQGTFLEADWRRIMQFAETVEGVRIRAHEGHFELVGPAEVTRENWVLAPMVGLPYGARLLFDYRSVQRIDVPLEWFLAAAEQAIDMGMKIAVVTATPAAFGLMRQTALTAGIDEERSFRAFPDFDEAKSWLLAN